MNNCYWQLLLFGDYVTTRLPLLLNLPCRNHDIPRILLKTIYLANLLYQNIHNSSRYNITTVNLPVYSVKNIKILEVQTFFCFKGIRLYHFNCIYPLVLAVI